jgi:phosphoribosyl-AMP cyclohydrolase
MGAVGGAADERATLPFLVLRGDLGPEFRSQSPFFQCAYTMDLDFSKLGGGLLTAVVQDYQTNRVLMVGFMNQEAFRTTVETGCVTFYSRSRQKLWLKGETSGHKLLVKEIATDCDKDALLIKVEAQGPGVCHEGYQSCFFRTWQNGQWMENETRAYDPADVYGS